MAHTFIRIDAHMTDEELAEAVSKLEAFGPITATVVEPKRTVTITRDVTPSNPRLNYDHIGTMVCAHKRYDMGDEDATRPPAGAFVLPIYMLDHSRIALSHTPFTGPHAAWDSGLLGEHYITPGKAAEEGIDFEDKAKLAEILKAELQEYQAYMDGDVWGYVIEDEEGSELDSCWGYYGSTWERVKHMAEGYPDLKAQFEQAWEGRE